MTFSSNDKGRRAEIDRLELELEALLQRLRDERKGDGKSIATQWKQPFVGANEYHAVLLRHYIKARTDRSRVFPGKLFADPAWDILLMLYLHAIEGRESIAKHAYIATGVPGTTSLRYLTALEESGLIVRTRGHFDQRTSVLNLTTAARAAMESWVENSLAGLVKLLPGGG